MDRWRRVLSVVAGAAVAAVVLFFRTRNGTARKRHNGDVNGLAFRRRRNVDRSKPGERRGTRADDYEGRGPRGEGRDGR